MSLNVVTYNVLANSTALPKFFDLPLEHLSLKHRIPLLLTKIQQYINKEAVICLQEVDLVLMGAGLHQLFSQSGYYCITSHYSTLPDRDYMGVCIAFPVAKYSLVKYGEVKIGDKIVLPLDVEVAESKNGNTLFEEAKKRDTRMLWVKLRNEGKDVFICTYHMPCCFWWVPVMTLHIDTLLKQIEELTSEDVPIVLVGDFNAYSKGNTKDILNFISKDIEFSELPTPLWKPSSTLKLKNAGVINTPTTMTKSPGRDVFKECLDYIFVKGCVVEHACGDVPSKLMPNDTEGSDHMPVYAELLLV